MVVAEVHELVLKLMLDLPEDLEGLLLGSVGCVELDGFLGSLGLGRSAKMELPARRRLRGYGGRLAIV